MEPHDTATENHLPMGSHSVIWQPTQVNTPRLNPSQTGRYSICLPRRDGRLSWPRWLITYRDGLPAGRGSPIQVVTGPVSINYVDQSQSANLYTTQRVSWVCHKFNSVQFTLRQMFSLTLTTELIVSIRVIRTVGSLITDPVTRNACYTVLTQPQVVFHTVCICSNTMPISWTEHCRTNKSILGVR